VRLKKLLILMDYLLKIYWEHKLGSGSTRTVLPRNFEEGNTGALNGWPGQRFMHQIQEINMTLIKDKKTRSTLAVFLLHRRSREFDSPGSDFEQGSAQSRSISADERWVIKFR
jgi:hypothetical protein